MKCSAAERRQFNYAWDEQMFKVLHVDKSRIPACSTTSKPVKQHTSLCKDLREMLRYEQPTAIQALFYNASRCGCTDAELLQLKYRGDCAVIGECAWAKEKISSLASTTIGTLAEAMAKCSEAIRKTFGSSGDCIYRTTAQEGVTVNGQQTFDITAAEEADLFDCRSCSKDQMFVGSGKDTVITTDCKDEDLAMEILFVGQTDGDPLTVNMPESITCADIADRGLCKFPEKAFYPGLRSEARLDEVCGCSCAVERTCFDYDDYEELPLPAVDMQLPCNFFSSSAGVPASSPLSCTKTAADIARYKAEQDLDLAIEVINDTIAAAPSMEYLPLYNWCPVTCGLGYGCLHDPGQLPSTGARPILPPCACAYRHGGPTVPLVCSLPPAIGLCAVFCSLL
jgi:hypothetical protein